MFVDAITRGYVDCGAISREYVAVKRALRRESPLAVPPVALHFSPFYGCTNTLVQA